MSTHNICFRGEISKIFTGYPALSRPMQYCAFFHQKTLGPRHAKTCLGHMRIAKAQIRLHIRRAFAVHKLNHLLL